MEIELIEVDASTPKRKIVLDRLPIRIGQGPDAGVHLDDQWVSRDHCEINAVKGTLVVRDLGSMLGTFVNGLNVTTALLMPGDKLTVGETSFLVDYERRIAARPAGPPTVAPAPRQTARPHGEEAERGTSGLFSLVLHRATLLRKHIFRKRHPK